MTHAGVPVRISASSRAGRVRGRLALFPIEGCARVPRLGAGLPSLFGVAALLAAAAAAAAVPTPALDPDVALRTSQAAIGRRLADHAFLDRQGRPVRLADYRGKPLLVSFVYTGCTSACPPATKLLAQAVRKAQSVVGSERFRVLTIGFNPPQDSPEAMREFARRFGIDLPNWEFVTPDEAQVAALAADFGFSYAPAPWGFDHLAQVTVVDPEGRIYRQVYGEDFPLERLIDPLKELIEGTPVPVRSLGELIERVRLLCTVYDPRTNRYRFKTTIIGEIVSFAAITVALVWFVWFERRRRRSRAGR